MSQKVCSICNEFKSRSEYSAREWKKTGSRLRECRQCAPKQQNKMSESNRPELAMSQREALARSGVQQLIEAINQDLYPAKSVEGLFGINMHAGPIIDPMEIPLGQVVFNAWITIIKIHKIVSEDELVCALLEGKLKEEFQNWLKRAISYYTVALLEHFKEISWWDQRALDRIAGAALPPEEDLDDVNATVQKDNNFLETDQQQNISSRMYESLGHNQNFDPMQITSQTPPGTISSPSSFIGRQESLIEQQSSFLITRCMGRNSSQIPIHGFAERRVSNEEHKELIRRGSVAPIPNLLGFKIRVVRLHPNLQPGYLADNSVGVYLMADANSGLAPLPWAQPGKGGLGPVDIIREDGDLGLVDAALLHEYMDHLMDSWSSGRPTDKICPQAFQFFLHSRIATLSNGQSSLMQSGETAMISFSDIRQLHLLN
mmetsp:Transcript_14729/g.19582  ORF Transcript_14729/g.19582 Transcript_14729/m.19582 type:complete len:430 (+) Transcript_14729:183-1472(+)